MMLPRLRRSLKETDFDLVIWQVGSNDAISTGNAAVFRSAMDQGIETILASGSDLLLLDQQYVEPWRDKQNWQHYVALVEIGAKNKAVNVLSRYQSMKRLHGRDLRALEGLLAPDAIHMNDKGYACLAEAIGLSIQSSPARRRRALTSGRTLGGVLVKAKRPAASRCHDRRIKEARRDAVTNGRPHADLMLLATASQHAKPGGTKRRADFRIGRNFKRKAGGIRNEARPERATRTTPDQHAGARSSTGCLEHAQAVRQRKSYAFDDRIGKRRRIMLDRELGKMGGSPWIVVGRPLASEVGQKKRRMRNTHWVCRKNFDACQKRTHV